MWHESEEVRAATTTTLCRLGSDPKDDVTEAAVSSQTVQKVDFLQRRMLLNLSDPLGSNQRVGGET